MNISDTILITGGSGMLGQHLSRQLTEAGYTQVLCPTKDELNLLELENVKEYLEKQKPAYVFHLAGLVYGLGGNLNHQLDALYLNTMIHVNFLQAIRSVPVQKIFFAGTVASYPFPYHQLPLTEDQMYQGKPHKGEYGYAVGKNVGYQFLELLHSEMKIDYCIGLFTNLFGEFDRFNIQSGHVVPSLIYKMYLAVKNNDSFPVWGSGEATRDFLYAEDAARAAIFLMNEYTGMINISSGKECSMKDLVTSLVKASNYQGEIVWQKDAPVGIARRSVDNSRLCQLGFTGFTSLDQALQKTYNWFTSVVENGQIRT